MKNVLLVDDEAVIREGLKLLIDWESYGFTVTGFSANGNDAVKKIMNLRPDLVIMDIRMPGLSGIEVLAQVRSKGYEGEIVILSGYSEFEYARAALGYNVCGYLTKPVDEEALTQILKKASQSLDRRSEEKRTKDQYYEKFRIQLVRDLLVSDETPDEIQREEYDLGFSVYQVLTYERFDPKDPKREYSFAELLTVSGMTSETFVHLNIEGEDILLLLGEAAIRRFSDVLAKFSSELAPQADSPLSTLFITYGKMVNSLEAVPYSYQEAVEYMKRRFYCDEGVHVSGGDDTIEQGDEALGKDRLEFYTDALSGLIQSFNRSGIAEKLTELKLELTGVSDSIEDVRLFLTDLFLSVKEKLNHLYAGKKLPFATNSDVIRYIREQFYLYEILRFLSEQFEHVMAEMGGFSGDSVMDAVAGFIAHNYAENITLENIAPLFGYNSSYLGKIFARKMGENFNSYLDKVRIEEAKRELLAEGVKVYTVAERVGYKNVDYFHVKFKKYTGLSPAEYRKQSKENK